MILVGIILINTSGDTVDGSNPANQLRLEVDLIPSFKVFIFLLFLAGCSFRYRDSDRRGGLTTVNVCGGSSGSGRRERTRGLERGERRTSR